MSCTFSNEAATPPPTVTTTTAPPPPAIPAIALDAYASVGKPCPGVDWAVVAAIGKVESNHGRIFGGQLNEDGLVSPPIFGPNLDGSGVGGNLTPFPMDQWAGVHGLEGEWLQAVGPMQFLPDSFDIHGADGNNDGQLDPHNLYDAVAAASNLLCSASADADEDASTDDLILAYNRSAEYQGRVLGWAERYRQGSLKLGD